MAARSSRGSFGSPSRPLSPVEELLEPGRMVERYRICRLAGMGGMGEVYQAWDTALERYVALKAVRPNHDDLETTLERFRREALALAQLNHPHVCQVYDLVQDEVGTFIAMEWLEGKTLDQALPDLDPRARIRVLRETAEGLAAAHAKGLVHRDLKPSNLMVLNSGTVKILDFGLARHGALGPSEAPVALQDALWASQDTTLPVDPGDAQTGAFPTLSSASTSDPLTQAGFFMGSPRYASPEQIQGILAGPPSDVFALGIVLWEAVHGEHPFPGEGKARFKAILDNERRAPAKRIPHTLARLLERMLAPRPEDRPSASEVASVLKSLQSPLAHGWWIALGASLSLLITVTVYFVLARGILADLTRQRPARVAILAIENRSGDPTLEAELRWVIPDVLASALSASPRLVPRVTQEVSNRAPVSLEAIARREGADLLLSSTLQRTAKGGWSLSYQLQEPSGRIRYRGSSEVEGTPQNLYQALPRAVAQELLRAVDPLGLRSPQHALQLDPETLQIYAQGRECMERGQFQAALDPLSRVCQRAPHFGSAIVHYGIALQKCGDARAELAIQWGRWAAHATGNRRAEIMALTQQGVLHMERGQWDPSRKAFEEAMALAKAARDEDFQAALLNNLGYLALEQNRLDEAEGHLHRALAIEQRLGKMNDIAITLNNLAVSAKHRGNHALAAQHYQKVLETMRANGDRWGESMAENNLGDAALAMGNFQEAARHFSKSLQLKRAIGHRTGTIIPLANLGILARVQGEATRAEAYLREALELCRELKRKPLEPIILQQWGALALAQRKPSEALLHFQEAARLHEQLQNRTQRADALAGCAEALLQRRDWTGAERFLNQARTLDPKALFVLRAEAELAWHRHRIDEARAILQRALALARLEAPEEVPELEKRLARGTPPQGFESKAVNAKT